MDKIKKILFYNDSTVYGGHEIMSIKIANLLSTFSEYSIEFMYFNKKIKSMLNKDIKTHSSLYSDKTPLPFIRNLNIYKILKIKKKISNINPDCIIICQGTIELSLKGLIASKLLNKKTISYLPYGNTFNEIGAILSFLRDFINKNYYSFPDYFITPNAFQKQLISKQIKHNEIFIISNPINIKNDVPIVFKLNTKISICIIGRVDFKHKNQIIAIDIAKKMLFKEYDFIFHIIGDGKDLSRFKKLVYKNNLSQYFIFYGWKDGNDKDEIINEKVDIVLIPSKIETGIPLVVYDSLKNNKKFLLSDMNSIKDYNVPNQFLIDINNIDSIIEKILYLSELTDASDYIKFRSKIFNEHSIDNFAIQTNEVFNEILCGH